MKVYVNAIAVRAPGLDGWTQAAPVLRGQAPFMAAPLRAGDGKALPAGERRRASATIRLAVDVAKEAADALDAAARARLATVFASANGDGETIHHICEALASPERQVSPTRFHNSVHNAAAGYWGIASGVRAASTSVAAYDDSVAAGLLEAAAQAQVERTPVMLVAYDTPYPPPLAALRPARDGFACALVLAPQAAASCRMALTLACTPDAAGPTRMTPAPLEALRLDTGAGRALPLLAALARRREGRVVLRYADNDWLQITLTPCP